MLQKTTELILMALFFGACLWANASEAAENAKTPNLQAQATTPPLMTFEIWKTQRIQIAQKALAALKNNPKAAEAPGELARQMEYNLEVAHGLTISDYFVLYLKNKSAEDIQILAKTLSPEDVATLLLGYKKLSGTPKVASASPEPEAKLKSSVKN